MNEDVINFLRESNNIEDEWDDMSLQQAIFAWEFLKDKKKLTVADVLMTHKILMKHHKTLYDEEKGALRRPVREHTGEVWIAGRPGKPWFALPELIQNWVILINDDVASKKMYDEKRNEQNAQDTHVQYENIHPFIDGNGRTGRIFLNWEREKLGLPILVIKESEKHKYYEWFSLKK